MFHRATITLFFVALLTTLTAAQGPCGTWTGTPVPTPPGATMTILTDVSVAGPNEAWAVGYYRLPNFETHTLAMHWDGTSWTIVPTPSPSPYPGGTTIAELHAVEARGPNDVWAAGNYVTPGAPGAISPIGPQVLILHWDGNTWSQVTTPLTPPGTTGAGVLDMVSLTPTDLLFVGNWITATSGLSINTAMAMHWDGTSFQFDSTPVVASGSVTHQYRTVTATDPANVWAAGRVGNGSACGLPRILDRWAASGWTTQTTPAIGLTHCLEAIEAVSPTDVWAVGSANIGGTLGPVVMHFDGTAWSTVPTPAFGQSLLAMSSQDVFMGGLGIYHWDGVAWTLFESFPGISDPTIRSMERVGNGCEAWAVGTQGLPGSQTPFIAHYGPSIPPAVWQTNQPEATFKFGNGSNTPSSGPIVTVLTAGTSTSVTMTSTLVGHSWDVFATAAFPQPSVLTTPGGQIVNITGPGVFPFFGGFTQMMPSGGLIQSITTPPGLVIVFVGQMVVLDPAHPDGLWLSAANLFVSQ
ncbi:MAG: hypothetical protein KDB53_12975 [Planctomycetes bacterium]|nr:hypothetical protein [Planctomycetota bacterium]